MNPARPDPSLLADAPRVPVSWGELIDKMTILEIKSERLTGEAALANVRLELSVLAEAGAGRLAALPRLQALKADLRTVNEALWDIEDDIRRKEAVLQFDEGFVALARSVYRQNDRRASIKRAINELLGSALVEEKSYAAYRS